MTLRGGLPHTHNEGVDGPAKFNPAHHEEELTAALQNAQTFAFKHIAPMTDPNTGTSTSEHSTCGTPSRYTIKGDLKRSLQLGLVNIGGGHTKKESEL